MKNDVVPVEIRGILPANSGCAIFVGNEQKVFVIQVEHNMGAIIGMFLRDTPKERPLTHDLIEHRAAGLVGLVGFLNYFEHGRTFPNQRANAGPDQN